MAPATIVERSGRPRSPSRIPHPVSHTKKAVKSGKAVGSTSSVPGGKAEGRKASGRKSIGRSEGMESREDDENDSYSDTPQETNDDAVASPVSLTTPTTPTTPTTLTSFAERAKAVHISRVPTSKTLLVKGDRLLPDIDRAPPGDSPHLRTRHKSLLTLGSTGSSEHDPEVTRQSSQYFANAFSARDGNTNPAKERVHSEALVLAELRTNVRIGDEFTVITELSANLALRYRRPLSSVVVTLQHNSCMCFGGSFDPAYVMSIYALPNELQPATNRRNAALIQKHMEEAIGVPSSRGFLRFEAVAEANLAYGGKTMAGYVDDLTKKATSGIALPTNRAPASTTTTDLQDITGNVKRARAGRVINVKSLSSFKPSLSSSTHPPSQIPRPTQPAGTAKEPKPQAAADAEKPKAISEAAKEETAQPVAQEPSRPARRRGFFARLFRRSKKAKHEEKK